MILKRLRHNQEKWLNVIVLTCLLFSFINPGPIIAASPPPSESSQLENSQNEEDNFFGESILPSYNSPRFEEARARASMEVALRKYLFDWGPRYQTNPIEVSIDGDWALGIAQWKFFDAATFGSTINVLAQRQPDGTWISILPDSTDEYNKMVEAAPATLIPIDKKNELISQGLSLTYVTPEIKQSTQSMMMPDASTLLLSSNITESINLYNPNLAPGLGIYYSLDETPEHPLGSNRIDLLSGWPETPFVVPSSGYIGWLQGKKDSLSAEHNGVDIWSFNNMGGTPPGNEVYLVYDGTLVDFIYDDRGRKMGLVFEHNISSQYSVPEHHVYSLYFHMANDATGESYISTDLVKGQFFPLGTILGRQGNDRWCTSGCSYTESIIVHLHYCISTSRSCANKLDFMPYLGLDLSYPVPPYWMTPILYNGPSSGGTCSAPTPTIPNDGFISPGNEITFAWNQTACSGQNGYYLRVGTSAGGSDVLSDYAVQGLQTNYTFDKSEWYNRDLYWSVRANASGAFWSKPRHFRIEPPAPSCNPGADQVAVFVNTGFSTIGQCVVKGIGDYADPTAIGLPDNSISSIKVGGNVKATLCTDQSFSGSCYDFLSDNGDLNYSPIGTQTSSMKVSARVQPPSIPSLIAPGNGDVFSERSGFDLSWSSTGDQYIGEIWGGPEGTISFGPQSNTSYNFWPQGAGYIYSWHVKSQNSAGMMSDWSDSRKFTVKPGIPTNLDAQVVSCSQINLSWGDNSDYEEGYKIYRNDAYLTSVGVGVTSYTDSGLSGNTDYSYYVRAYRGSIESNSSFSVYKTTPSCVSIPAAPTLLSPENEAVFVEGESISLAWSATGNQYSGEIWGGPGGTLTFGPQSETTNDIGPQWAGYNYSWHVNAQNSAGTSGWSSPSTYTVLPGTPSNLIAQSPACDQANLSWADNSGNEEGYHIYRDGFYIASVGSDQTNYSDSGLSGDSSYTYTVNAYRESIESYSSNPASVTTPSCIPSDTEAPLVNWVEPVENEQAFFVVNEIITLTVSATDNIGVDRVLFSRWDAVILGEVEIGNSYTSPYSYLFDCSTLNIGWNEIHAVAYDAAGNVSDQKYIWLYRNAPLPDLIPFTPQGYSAPVVPSSITGTQESTDLYAGLNTYFDWHFANDGWDTAPGTFYVELWVDEIRYIHYSQPDIASKQIGGWDDWGITIDTPGWHLVKLVVDPDNTVSESDETNNAWEGWFYWTPSAPFYDDFEIISSDWTSTGLWHHVTNTSTYSNSLSGVGSWWYGQDDTGNYDTGEANSGDLISPIIFIPTSDHYYLRFNYWYEAETKIAAWDQRWVQVSVDGGPFISLIQLYDDNMGIWQRSPVIDLDGLGGHTLQTRFHFDSIDTIENAYRGWYIDDFSISTNPLSSCADIYEPNDDIANATPIFYGDSLSADICTNGDYDYYQFDAQPGDGVVVDIDAGVIGSSLDPFITLLDGDGKILGMNDDDGITYDSKMGYVIDTAGTYYIRVRDYGHPSNGGPELFYNIKLFTDTENPSAAEITNPLSEDWINPITQVITATANDADSGIRQVEFLWHSADWQNGDWVWLGLDEIGGDGWSYYFDTSALEEQQQAGALYIFATDYLGNYTGSGSWNLGIDRTSPTTTLTVSPMYGDAPFRDFYVFWNGDDNLSGVVEYDVQVRGDSIGDWTDIMPETIETYLHFVGDEGQTFYFQSRARDAAGNESQYVGGDGQGYYKVQVCPVGEDSYETDNSAGTASGYDVGDPSQSHNFHTDGDEDWIMLYLQTNRIYSIWTTNVGSHADTVLELYDSDGATLLTSNDDYEELGLGSLVRWQPSTSGIYYARVYHWDSYAFGCTTGYEFEAIDSSPQITSINPDATLVGGSPITLTVNGVYLTSDSEVHWNSTVLSTTFISDSQLSTVIPADLIASPGVADITVFAPILGGINSNTVSFSINNPPPGITSLSPNTKMAGEAAFTLTVNGSNFVNGAIVQWSGSNRTTTFISETQLQAAILASDIASAGTASVTVFNPTPGGGTSEALTFAINNPQPAITSLSPTSKTAGVGAFTLTVNGSNFVNGTVVRWNDSNRTTTFISETQLQAAIPASDIASAGTSSVTVFNPTPGGGTSTPFTFLVVSPSGLPLEVPVLVLSYYPPDSSNPAYLDPVETGWTNILITDMQNATQGMIDAGQALINDATRYHGYRDPGAPQYLAYYTYEQIEYFYAMPRGYPLDDTQHRPHYNQILNSINICDYVDTHGVKEVWIYGYHASVIVPDESKMSSKYGDVSNAYPKDEYIPEEYRLPRCTNSYVIYNFTYQPGGAQAIGNNIHNRLHQIENVIFFAENLGYPPNDSNVIGSIFWDDFSVYGTRASLPGYRASCGNTHSPPNTTEGYDYDSVDYHTNNCETWNPNDSLTTYINANCTQWGCTDIGFYKWFMQNMPGYNNGIVYNGKQMRNWWDAMYDFNQFIDSGRSLFVTSTSTVYLPLTMNNYTIATTQPVFVYPVDGQTLSYDGDWLFKVETIANAQGFLWGFLQNGQLVWENMSDEGTLSSNEYAILVGSEAHSKFSLGSVEVLVRALINDNWTEATTITIYLE